MDSLLVVPWCADNDDDGNIRSSLIELIATAAVQYWLLNTMHFELSADENELLVWLMLALK